MADKFAITAELHVRLANSVNKDIDALRKKAGKVKLDVSLNKRKFNEHKRYITDGLKNLRAKVKESKLQVSIDRKIIRDDKRYILDSFRKVRQSITEKPIKIKLSKATVVEHTNYIRRKFSEARAAIKDKPFEIGLDRAGIDNDIKYLIASVKLTKASLESKPINVGINRTALDNDIKYILASMRSVLTSLTGKNSTVKIDADIAPEFTQFNQALSGISGKTIRLNLPTRDKTINKFLVLANNINSLNAAITSFDINRLASLTSRLGAMSTYLGSLANLSRRKYNFNFNFKNIKTFDTLYTKLQHIQNGFNQASLAGIGLFQVISQIGTAIKGLGNVKVNFGSKNGSNGQAGLKKSINATTGSIEELGYQTGITFKRFGAYTIATAGFFQLTFALKAAISEFIEYEKELTKVRQVTGQSLATTEILSKRVGELATSYGVSSKKILDSSLVLAQAGYTAREVTQSLEALAKTELAATFEDLPRTVEGSVAAMAQFGYKTDQLVDVLSSVNSVSAKFAVESTDIITAIQKTGGAFAAAGGNLNELQALFTAVRATTRESADTIATGFRTIFTRLQRVRTQEFLRDFGINLNYTAEEARKFGKTAGEFVGPYEAIRRLNAALSEISTTDPRYAQITEELGGFRQISKVIPLLQQFPKAMEVLNVAQKSNNSLTEDAVIAQESFANKLTKVREEFLLVIREFGSDREIKTLINGFIDLASSLVQVLKYTRELIPAFTLLGGLAAIPVGGKFIGAAAGLGGITKKAAGGFIPGSGNKDDVPALLMKGEYVLNKRTVRKIGKENLDKLNFQRFATGGSVGGSKGGGGLNIGPAGIVAAFATISLAQSAFGELNDVTQKLVSAVTAGVVAFKLLEVAINATKKDVDAKIGKTMGGKGILSNLRSSKEDFRNSTKEFKNKQQQYAGSILDPTRRQNLVQYIDKKKQQEAYNKDQFEQTAVKLRSSRFTAQMSPSQIRNLQRRALQYRTDYKDAKSKRQTSENRLFQSDTAQQDLNESGARVADADKRYRNNRNKFQRIRSVRNTLTNSAKFGGGAAIAGTVGGQALSDLGSSELDKARERLESGGAVGDLSKAKALSVGGSVLSGAAQGAGVGALIGSALGPPGAAIGAAAGAFVGGVTSYVSATKEFEKTIRSFEVQKITDNLDSTLKSFAEGKTTSSIASGSVLGDLKLLQQNLQNESDPDIRKDIKASLNNNSVQIDKFVKDLAVSSGSVKNFNQKIDESSRRFIAGIIGIPFSELSKQVEQQIDSAKEAKKFASQQASARSDYESQIRSLISLRQAFVYAEAKVNNFGDTLQSFLSESSGSTSVKTSFSEIPGLDAVPDLSKFSKDISDFTGTFGAAGKEMGGFVTEGAKAFESLPNILLDLKAKGSFGNKTDLSDSLSDQLDAAGISGSIKRVILAKLPEVLGQDFKDSEFFKKLDEDFAGVVKTFTDGFSTSMDLLREAAQKSADQLNTFGSGLDVLRASQIKGISDEAGLQDFNTKLTESRDTFKGVRPSFDALASIQDTKTNVMTGGKSVAQLQAESLAARSNVLQLEQQKQNTTDPLAQKALLEAINQEKLQIDKTTQSLKYLAESTGKLAVLQAKLNSLQGDRLKNKDFATDAVFGDRQSRVRQQKVLNAAQIAASSGSAMTIPDELKQEVLSFYRSFGDTQLPGMQITGTQAIDKILLNSGVSPDVVNPGKEETTLQTAIETQITNAASAQQALNDILAADRTTFSQNLQTQFNDFLTNLNQSLNKSMAGEVNTKLSSAQSSLAKKQKDLAFVNSVGSAGLNNIDSIKTTEEKLKKIGNDPEALSQNLNNFRSLRAKALETSTLTRDGWGKGIRRSSFDDANAFFDSATAGVSDDARNRIMKGVSESDIGRNQLDKTVDLSKFGEAIKAELQKEIQTSSSERSTYMNQKDQLIQNVGGYRNYSKLAPEAETIQKEAAKLDSKDSKELAIEIAKLTGTIQDLQKQKQVLGFASGGIVPGSGNFDSVPARLTPGEGVITKQAMAKYGPGLVNSINKGAFPKNYASGGVVSGAGITIDTESLTRLNLVVQNLSTQIDRLQAAFGSIPTEISMNGKHTVELIINGAQVLTQIHPEIVKLVESGAKDAINKMLKSKFPQVGSYNG